MSATPEETAMFRDTMADIAAELVRPINDSLRQLALVLAEPAGVRMVGAERMAVTTTTVTAAMGPKRLLAADPSRLYVLAAYDSTAGAVAMFVGGSDQITVNAGVVQLPPIASTAPLRLDYSGDVYALTADATGRPVQLVSFYRL